MAAEDIDPRRVRVATVAPAVEPWRSEVLRLVRSVRVLDSPLRAAQIVCYIDRVADSELASALHDLSATVRLISPVDARAAMGNNQVMLDDDGSYDWLVALDCDIVVTGDFSAELAGDALGAAPVNNALVPLGEWRQFFECFGLEMPSERFRSLQHATVCPPYYNAGVLIVPSRLVTPTRKAWAQWLARVVDAFEEGQVPVTFRSRKAFSDQLAFMLAVAAERIPHRALPVEMHVATKVPIHPMFHPEIIEPSFIHYHHHVDDRGNLIATGYAGIDRVISRFTSSLEECV